MTIWGIADLHLDFARPLDREQYAGRWEAHALKIENEWRQVVRREDLVLIPGDISMARNHRDLQPDLAWLDRLPGTKVLSAGNHDRWWNGIEKIRPMLRRSLLAVDGDAVATHGVIVCGTRGAMVSREGEEERFKTERERQHTRLEAALESALGLRRNDEPIFVLWHFPPFDQHGIPDPCVARFEAIQVSQVVYGHLHNQGQWSSATQGVINRVRYACVAADAIGFRPLRLATLGG